jgi:hypothetical protein
MYDDLDPTAGFLGNLVCPGLEKILLERRVRRQKMMQVEDKLLRCR